MITAIHPSRQRPKLALETYVKWISKRADYGQWILSIDSDDPNIEDYREHFRGLDVVILVNDNRSAVDAINHGAKFATGDILIVVSDDFDCPEKWDMHIEFTTRGKTDWIMKCPDGIQDWMITMPIMDRAYYERFGYIYYPEYRHMFCDTDLSCVADLLNKRIYAPIQFIHNHYSIGKFQRDSISDRADKTWQQGEEIFLRRWRSNFDLVNPPGKIRSEAMKNWIEPKLKTA